MRGAEAATTACASPFCVSCDEVAGCGSRSVPETVGLVREWQCRPALLLVVPSNVRWSPAAALVCLCVAVCRRPPATCGGAGLRSALVPLIAIVVHVTRPGRRANELLAAVATQLGRETPIADERGHVRILLEASEGAAWQRVNDALDAAGADWHEYFHVNARPG